jgi:putative flippase GtrA
MVHKSPKKIHSLFSLFFKEENDTLKIQLLRYFFVGGIAFLADFGALFLLTQFCHIYYIISAALSFLLGLIVNYILSTRWVFTSRSYKSKYLEFLVFSLIGVIGLGINEIFIWILTDALNVFYLYSKIITTIIVYFWNFFARKNLLFKKE